MKFQLVASVSLSAILCLITLARNSSNNTSDMQGMLWGEPELSHVCVFDHMVIFHSHNVNEV